MIFRIDDVGASSKRYEIYSKILLGNFLFLKYLKPFKAWGPYSELSEKIWEEILKLFEKNKLSLLVGITSCWVEEDGSLTPFPQKFPKQAKVIKLGVERGVFEIANHGLTHCIVGKHKPRLFFSNRNYHREFWPWVSLSDQEIHFRESQKILQSFFETEVRIFIPPGNVWTRDTEVLAQKYGLKYLSDGKRRGYGILKEITARNTIAFHDRDIVAFGINWLEERLKSSGR